MGLLTLMGFLTFFAMGIVVGVMVQNQKHEQMRNRQSIEYWRWAHHKENIEQQMAKDGWRV